MTTVSQLLAQKDNTLVAVHPEDNIYIALCRMADANIGSVVVMQNGKVVGILTERGYARKVEVKGRTANTTRVHEIMETKVIYARPNQTVEECLAVMIDRRLRHLPVLDGTRLVGMISIGDLGKSIVGDQKFEIDQLVRYIHG
jgi:CBS domain-containing protein